MRQEKKKEKEYIVETKMSWGQSVTANSKKEAFEIVRQTFKDEFNLEPTDKEMKVISVKEVE